LNYVSGCLAEYKFNEAANAIYEFLWHEFCDWYIEIAKPTITGRNSQVILYKILEKSLRMLHPFMPFITEEIWQKLPKPQNASEDSIMAQPWPHVQDRMISGEDEEKMRELIEVITSIRNMRAVWNIEARVDVDVIINTNYCEDEKLLSDNIDLVKKLAKVSSLKIGKHSKPKSSAVSVIRKMEIFLPLEGLIDFEKEKARLLKEHLRMEGEMKGLSSRLKDKNFTSKAPKEIVDKQEERKAELSMQIKKMKDNLREIGV